MMGAVYRTHPCGCAVAGEGNLRAPLEVRWCSAHLAVTERMERKPASRAHRPNLEPHADAEHVFLVHSRCHMQSPTWVRYHQEDGETGAYVDIHCGECDGFVVRFVLKDQRS